MVDPFSISGRKVLVTGAAGGIGRAISDALLQAGANVFETDIDAKALGVRMTNNQPGRLGARVADLTNETSVIELFDTAEKFSEGLDGIVHAAGKLEKLAATRNQDFSDWSSTLSANLASAFLVAREGARRMKSGASLVFISSVGGLVAMPASNAYGVSKAGVNMLTKTLACDLARMGIRVNCIAPGPIEAPMVSAVASAARGGEDSVRSRVPLGRIGHCQDVANAVIYLLSPASDFVTGAVLPVDGGWSAFGGIGPASRVQS